MSDRWWGLYQKRAFGLWPRRASILVCGSAMRGKKIAKAEKKLLSWKHCVSQRKGQDRVESKARYDTHSAISCPGYLYQTEMPADKRGVLMEGSFGVGG